MMLSRRPIAPLAAHIDTLWASERGPMPHAREYNLPTGRADIVIPLLDRQCISRYADSADARGEQFAGAVVHGAHDRACQRETREASSVVGVHFRPGGAAAFFGGALPALRNRTVALEDLWGPSVRALRDELQEARGPHARLLRLEAWLMARLGQTRPTDAVIEAAVDTMARDAGAGRIEPVQRASGLGAGRFIARFEQAVGLTPKRYARVLRFHALVTRVAHAPATDWALAAAEAGYADQSHLTHEFKRLAGITPAAYQPLTPEHPTHMAVGREKIFKTR
ncbi:MAG: helix-turn-helix domain-containing protein [Rhizobacter sp.]|nr:helix-turn-helix domain-containing protein [Rhizobacter sp.]